MRDISHPLWPGAEPGVGERPAPETGAVQVLSDGATGRAGGRLPDLSIASINVT